MLDQRIILDLSDMKIEDPWHRRRLHTCNGKVHEMSHALVCLRLGTVSFNRDDV